MTFRQRRKRPIPILDDVVRGRGGVAGGLFTFDPTDTPPYDFFDGFLTTEEGDLLTTESEGKIHV
jgi:hypothetical protein